MKEAIGPWFRVPSEVHLTGTRRMDPEGGSWKGAGDGSRKWTSNGSRPGQHSKNIGPGPPEHCTAVLVSVLDKLFILLLSK